jgi:hypothetical protein
MSAPVETRLPPELESRRMQIAEICARYGVRTLEVFGSAVKGAFDAARSDLDFLVDFHPNRQMRSFDQYFGLKEELEALFARPVDLVMEGASSNRYFLESLNKSRRLLYGA